MPLQRVASLLFSLSLGLACLGCSPAPQENSNTPPGSEGVNSSNSDSPKDNIEEFTMLVRLPFQPEEVTWKEQGKTLIAVVRFSSDDADRMSAELAKYGTPVSQTLTVEKWYPNELVAQSDLGGESTIKGESYPANPFLNPPYTTGTITRIESTDYFIIQMSS